MDRRAKTVRIPRIKSKHIVSDIRRILNKKRVPLKRYQKIIRKICDVDIILPGTKGLFSPINKALKGEPPIIVLRKNI